jgi:hypothetical protein
MPTAEEGRRIARLRPSQSRRNDHTVTTSWTIRIGSMIAAACTGDTTSAISGSDSSPMPEKPPFDSPMSVTAGIAAA